MKHLYILPLLFLAIPALAQETYKGEYLNGEVEYSYITDERNQRLYDGSFTYSEAREIDGRGPCEIMVTGRYKNDRKVGPWAVTIKAEDGPTETMTGNYINGAKLGVWTHRLSADNGAVSLKDVSASFNKNKFKGEFKYILDRPETGGKYKHVEVMGTFDDKGLYDGVWRISYIGQDDVVYEDILKFKHGVWYGRELKNKTNDEVLEKMDKEKNVLGYFANVQPDSSAKVGDKRFGLTSSTFEHEMMLDALESFYKSEEVVIGNHFGSAIPMMVIDHGEEKMKPARTFELIDWLKTEKGQAEWKAEQERIRKEEERKRVQAAYDAKVAEANEARDEKRYEDAIAAYEEAMKIKPELYPQQQIPKVKELIRIRDKKNAMITSIGEKEKALSSTQKSIMGNEEFNKKQKHLAETYALAYDYRFKQVKGDHSKVRTFISNDNRDGLEIEDMTKYEEALMDVMTFQNKIRELIGSDTKDLEKELKKMEDPGAIYERLSKL